MPVQRKVFILAQNKELTPQNKVNESITLLILKHDKDIMTLTEEVNSLNHVTQCLTEQLLNKDKYNVLSRILIRKENNIRVMRIIKLLHLK